MAILVELTMRRRPPRPHDGSLLDGVRILELLPGEWQKDLRHANGDIVIRLRTDDETTSTQIRARVTGALAGSAMGDWELVACDPVAGERVSEDDQ